MLLFFDIHIQDGTNKGIDVFLKTTKFASPAPDKLSMDEVISEALAQGIIPPEAVDCIDEINEVPQSKYDNGNKSLELQEEESDGWGF